MEQYLPVIIACIGALIALVSFILGASGIVTFNGFRRDYEAESADLLRTNDKLRQELGDLKEACEILGHKINEQQQQLRHRRHSKRIALAAGGSVRPRGN